MREISILEQELLEKYRKLEQELTALKASLEDMPKGYLSEKTIAGKKRLYLQWKEDGHVRSQYVPEEEIPLTKRMVLERQLCMQRIKNLKQDLRQLVRAVGKPAIDDYMKGNTRNAATHLLNGAEHSRYNARHWMRYLSKEFATDDGKISMMAAAELMDSDVLTMYQKICLKRAMTEGTATHNAVKALNEPARATLLEQLRMAHGQ